MADLHRPAACKVDEKFSTANNLEAIGPKACKRKTRFVGLPSNIHFAARKCMDTRALRITSIHDPHVQIVSVSASHPVTAKQRMHTNATFERCNCTRPLLFQYGSRLRPKDARCKTNTDTSRSGGQKIINMSWRHPPLKFSLFKKKLKMKMIKFCFSLFLHPIFAVYFVCSHFWRFFHEISLCFLKVLLSKDVEKHPPGFYY